MNASEVYAVLIPIITESAKIAFFVGICCKGIQILLKAAFGNTDTWI